MSPNPVAGVAAWSAAATVDSAGIVLAAAVLGWDRWCPAGVAACPAGTGRTDRDALVLAILGGLLALVALLALVRGRLLLAVAQVALVAVLAVAADQTLPPAFDRLRTQLHLATIQPEIAFSR